jgi:uncharacterized membrane protein
MTMRNRSTWLMSRSEAILFVAAVAALVILLAGILVDRLPLGCLNDLVWPYTNHVLLP